jgi:hypothetical protein
VFIDDYSRFCWMFPLRQKSNVLMCYIKFKCLIENLPVKEENQDDKDSSLLTQLQDDPPSCMPKPAQQSSNFPLHQ